MVTIFKDEYVILYVSVYIPCDIFATTIIRIIISCAGRNSDVHFWCTFFFFFFYHDCIFINFYSNAVHKFPVYGTIKFYCIVLYCIVLYCIVLYCIVLYCIVLYCIVLYCIVLYCIVLYCIVLYCIVLYCIVLYCIVLYCIVLYCIVLYCIVLIRSTDRCLLRSIVRAIVASCDRRYYQSWGATIDRTINHSIVRPLVRSIVATYDRSYDQSWHQTIWNSRLEVLNLTIDLATTDFALAITHDLCHQSYIFLRLFAEVVRSFYALRRKPSVTVYLGVLNMPSTLLRMILPWRPPTTSATSRTFFLWFCPRFQHFSVADRS